MHGGNKAANAAKGPSHCCSNAQSVVGLLSDGSHVCSNQCRSKMQQHMQNVLINVASPFVLHELPSLPAEQDKPNKTGF